MSDNNQQLESNENKEISDKNTPKNKKHYKTFENQQYIINNAWCMSLNQLGARLGLDPRTVKKYYSEEIEASEADMLSLASESARDLLHERHYGMTDKILSKVGKLKDTDTSNNINISLNTYVDKPQDKTLEQWLETYSHKPQEIETIEPELIKE